MVLVGYSDSEASESETDKAIQSSTSRPEPTTTTKPNLKKRKDNTEPHKIRVTLPKPLPEDDKFPEDGEPAPKKMKASGGGFNAMLPAPKRQKSALASSARGKGLGSGISLKTGATPAFSRETPEVDPAYAQEEESYNDSGTQDTNGFSALLENTTTSEPPQKTGSAMVFKPLSVSRKPKKKSLAASVPIQTIASTQNEPPASKPKVSLFSTPAVDDEISRTITNHYEPIIHTTSDQTQEGNPLSDEAFNAPEATLSSHQSSSQSTPSLLSIADSLNLSASQRRQLLGRKGAGLADAKVMEFNTETEYAANEELRAKGETVTFNPIRSVASGKHSLQQLVNLVSNQKEALEESFAAGRRNKKEAGAKYGWS